MLTVKGTLDMTSVELSDGSNDNISHCHSARAVSFRMSTDSVAASSSASAAAGGGKVPINLSVITPDRSHRTMEVVFETAGDAVTFIFGITRTATKHNVKVHIIINIYIYYCILC